MGKWLDRVYTVSPPWIQRLAVNLYGFYWARRRLGQAFEEVWRAYVERESWPSDRMHDYVETQLREQVQRAYREVPYYRNAFRSAGVDEETLNNFTSAHLGKLPVLEKTFVRSHGDALLTKAAAHRPPRRFHTSGSTGALITIYMDTATHQHAIAVREARSFRWAGVSYRDPRCTLGGRLLVSPSQTRPPFWRYNRWEHQLYLSAHRMSEETVRDYVAALNRFRPPILEGYATAVHLFANLIEKLNLKVHSPRAIITLAERLEPYMRPVIESAFGARPFEEYGSAENCALATECERGKLHFHADFGYTEIVRPDGRPAGPGELGELLVTGFANTKQIFIRYRIGDLAAWAPEPCTCGRDGLPTLADLVGRVEDIAIAPDGRQIVRMYYIFRELPGILEGQIIQENLHRFVFNLVPGPSYCRTTIHAEIRHAFQSRFGLGPEVSVEIRELPSIPRGPNGKFRALISRVGAGGPTLHGAERVAQDSS
jgi:phenylacetate-CoA ligase